MLKKALVILAVLILLRALMRIIAAILRSQSRFMGIRQRVVKW